jgi:hypothetical protein
MLLLLLAGCTRGPTVAPTASDMLHRYRDCGWAGDPYAYAADCGDPQTPGRYEVVSDILDAVPRGWTCIADANFNDYQPSGLPSHDPRPVWRLYMHPPPGEDPLNAISQEYVLGLWFDVSNRSSSGVSGVLQDFGNPKDPIERWESPQPRGFVAFPPVETDPSVNLQGVLLTAPVVEGDVNYTPTARDDIPYQPWSRSEAARLPAFALEQNWARHSRFPTGQTKAFPDLYPTQVLALPDGLRYLPAFEFPISWHEEDPANEQGSGHWGSSFAGVEWTNVSADGARIAIHQAMPLRLYAQLDDVRDRSPACPCPAVVSHTPDALSCQVDRLPLPPVARPLAQEAPETEQVHPATPNLHPSGPA